VQASLYNGRAVCHMKMGNWEEAERDLLEAISKDAKNADTLANLVAVGLHLGKATGRYATWVAGEGACMLAEVGRVGQLPACWALAAC
jgi:hypothetical protein